MLNFKGVWVWDSCDKTYLSYTYYIVCKLFLCDKRGREFYKWYFLCERPLIYFYSYFSMKCARQDIKFPPLLLTEILFRFTKCSQWFTINQYLGLTNKSFEMKNMHSVQITSNWLYPKSDKCSGIVVYAMSRKYWVDTNR